eukprot:CAMPEP_0113873138 /NCGR_PEP_ID=MMETSP0780_2-20120614/3600_1 /TAXON_ID=652834 /ORGANISM="Palpitomonas bilix" /LENGTH=648 /DNA_ID=CAMNT_0000858743 /DNA_START=79 /DNA_END=2025 /DNA_ORIENTATION=+ /assembly_acc=CAM_ASM_000599
MWVALLSLAVLACWTAPVFALRSTKEVELEGNGVDVTARFGFFATGTADLHVHATSSGGNNSDASLLICSSTELSSYFVVEADSSLASFTRFCPRFDEAGPCTLLSANASGDIVMTPFTISMGDFYYFIMINCGGSTLEVEFSYVFLNPNGNELGSDEEPYPYSTLGLLSIWGAMCIMWLLMVVKSRRWTTKLHWVILLVPAAKVLALSILARAWFDCMHTGICAENGSDFHFFVDLLSKTPLFIILCFVSKGLWLLRTRLLLQEVLQIVAVVGFFVGSLFLNYWVRIAAFQVGSIFAVLLNVGLLMVLYVVYMSTARVLLILHRHVRHILRAGESPIGSTTATKQKMVLHFRSTTVIYICLEVLIVFVSNWSRDYVPWIEFLCYNVAELFVAMRVATLFAPKRYPAQFYRMPQVYSLSGNPYNVTTFLERHSSFSFRLPFMRRTHAHTDVVMPVDEEMGNVIEQMRERQGEGGEQGGERQQRSVQETTAEIEVFVGEVHPFQFRLWMTSHTVKREELNYYILPSLGMEEGEGEWEDGEEEMSELVGGERVRRQRQRKPTLAIVVNPSAEAATDVCIGCEEMYSMVKERAEERPDEEEEEGSEEEREERSGRARRGRRRQEGSALVAGQGDSSSEEEESVISVMRRIR